MIDQQPENGLHIVVVGESPPPADLPRAASVSVVDDYLQVIGEMSRRRVDVVVGRHVPSPSDIEPTVRAIRQLSPESRLLLVAEAGDEPQAMAAVRHGFDDYLIQPLRRGELGDALAKLTARTERLPIEVMLDNAGRGPAEAAAPEPSDRPLATTPAATGDEIPLLKALLADRGTLREPLLDALRATFGEDLHWAADADLNAAHCVPIAHGKRTFGHLVSDAIDDRQLGQAAERAAHWLAVERRLSDLKHEASHDELTGAWNRRYFDLFLASVLRRAREQRFRVTVLLFDIDDFKRYNDEFGHAAGDEILREAVRLMQAVVRRHDIVARVGGDEFGVIFWDAEAPRKTHSEHPRTARRAARRFRQAICDHKFPKLADLAAGNLTISGGLASYPWDGQTPEALLEIADHALLESKRQGKNAITLGPGAIRMCNGEDDGPADAPEG